MMPACSLGTYLSEQRRGRAPGELAEHCIIPQDSTTELTGELWQCYKCVRPGNYWEINTENYLD